MPPTTRPHWPAHAQDGAPPGESPPGSAASAYGTTEVHSGTDYTEEEMEFFRAVESYKKENRRRFLTLREYLRILKSLSYARTDHPTGQ